MIVDLSHTSVGTMRDALATSEAPVIFSHSSAYELCNSSRNVQDDILEMIAKNRGLVMVNFYSMFLSCNENATVHDAVGKWIRSQDSSYIVFQHLSSKLLTFYMKSFGLNACL